MSHSRHGLTPFRRRVENVSNGAVLSRVGRAGYVDNLLANYRSKVGRPISFISPFFSLTSFFSFTVYEMVVLERIEC